MSGSSHRVGGGVGCSSPKKRMIIDLCNETDDEDGTLGGGGIKRTRMDTGGSHVLSTVVDLTADLDEDDGVRGNAPIVILDDDGPDDMKGKRREANEPQDEESVAESIQRKQSERLAMTQTVTGRAWLLVCMVIDLQNRIGSVQSHPKEIACIAKDDMVYLAERFLSFQDFLEKHYQMQQEPADVINSATQIRLGYHYTRRTQLDSIRTHGLMNVVDRQASSAKADKITGSVFGDGVYIATNPYAFHNYGNVGILCAIIEGKSKRVDMSQYRALFHQQAHGFQTIIGNKGSHNHPNHSPYADELVLQQSCQCLPLIRYDAALIQPQQATNAAGELLWMYHQTLQKIIDTTLNENRPTALVRILPPTHSPQLSVPMAQIHSLPQPNRQHPMQATGTMANAINMPVSTINTYLNATQTTMSNQLGRKKAPKRRKIRHSMSSNGSTSSSIWHPPFNQPISYHAPPTLSTPDQGSFQTPDVKAIVPGDTCSICLDRLDAAPLTDLVQLRTCGHIFHRACVKAALTHDTKCPLCRVPVGSKPQGTCPSGTMLITKSSRPVAGYATAGALKVLYNIPNGIQQAYHPSPRRPYPGTQRTCYLPDTTDGRTLLRRLVEAWKSGLTFRIGTSMTTGQGGVVTWASVHHKTSRDGGTAQHGFPDPNYFQNCHRELDAVGVPPYDRL